MNEEMNQSDKNHKREGTIFQFCRTSQDVKKPSATVTFQPPRLKETKKKTPISRLVTLFTPCVTSFGSGPAALAQQSARAATTATCPGPHYPICKSLSALTVATQSPKLLSVWQRNQASLKGLSVFVFSQMKSGSDECSVWLPPYLESSNQVPVARVFSANGFDGFYTFARAVFLSDLS